MSILQKYSGHASPSAQITSANAKEGATYYITNNYGNDDAYNITGYENGTLEVERVLANRRGEPIMANGQYQKTSRSGDHAIKVYKHTSPTGEVRYVRSFPTVKLPENTAVVFVKPFIGYDDRKDGYYSSSDYNVAMVKRGDATLLVKFPLWAMPNGEQPTRREPNVAPPVKKSPPARELNPNAANAPVAAGNAPAAPREPRTGYKIYGRKGGRPAHTRLKGQAYGAPANTRFSPGEQASIEKNDDGRLTVKKQGGDDHSQLWDPIDG